MGKVLLSIRCWQAFGVALLAGPLAGTPAGATADGPDHYRVRSVAPGGHLNLRAEPSTSAPVLARIPADATCLASLGCRGGPRVLHPAPQLEQRTALDLAHALAGDAQAVAGLLQRVRDAVEEPVAHAQQQLLVTHGFDDEVAGADIDGIFIGVILAVTGHHDHIGLVLFFDDPRQLEPAQSRHFDIRDHHVKRSLLDHRQSGLGAASRFRLESRHTQVLADGIADFRFVINHQYALPHERRSPQTPVNKPSTSAVSG